MLMCSGVRDTSANSSTSPHPPHKLTTSRNPTFSRAWLIGRNSPGEMKGHERRGKYLRDERALRLQGVIRGALSISMWTPSSSSLSLHKRSRNFNNGEASSWSKLIKSLSQYFSLHNTLLDLLQAKPYKLFTQRKRRKLKASRFRFPMVVLATKVQFIITIIIHHHHNLFFLPCSSAVLVYVVVVVALLYHQQVPPHRYELLIIKRPRS